MAARRKSSTRRNDSVRNVKPAMSRWGDRRAREAGCYSAAMPLARPGPRLSFAAAGLLFLLLAVLATLQYRWIGEVSEAERERMQRALRSSAESVANDFDHEIARVFLAFEPPDDLDRAAQRLCEAAQRWKLEAHFPAIVREVFLARGKTTSVFELSKLDLRSASLSPVPWPGELREARRRLEEIPRFPPWSHRPALRHRGEMRSILAHHGELLLEDVPALIVPPLRRMGPQLGRSPSSEAAASPPTIFTVVVLDRRVLTEHLLPELLHEHFGERGEFDLAVLRRQTQELVYRSRPDLSAAAMKTPDVEVDFFSIVPSRALAEVFGPPPHGLAQARGLERTGHDRFDPRRKPAAWRLVARHRAGSLEAATTQTRRRNLLVSGGVLALLAAAFVTLLVSVRRAQRLARQQLEFAAGITHELRTPLAAIRSAGQNLADGVVSEAEQVKQYGRLVEREESRLTGLIEKSLEYAGIEAGRARDERRAVAIDAILEEAVAACRSLAGEQAASIEMTVAADLPPVAGNPVALRTLFENLLSNAIKYGGRQGRVTLNAGQEKTAIEVRVADIGPGISPEELPHIFEPFYRGRDVSSSAVGGTGLGLSLVRKIAEAHGGSVRVETAPGKGSTFIVKLPLPSPGAAPMPHPIGATS